MDGTARNPRPNDPTSPEIVTRDRNRTAIVIGAGMGGLLAARAAAGSFERVIVIERDLLDGGSNPRKGVPQGRHIHALLARGVREIESALPGVFDGIEERGGFHEDGFASILWHQGGGYFVKTPIDADGACASRGLLEALVRERVLALPQIIMRTGCSVTDLIWTSDKSSVTGVTIETSDGTLENIAARLVVDASGRGSRLPAWLKSAGYETPSESTIPVGTRYATRQFLRKPNEVNETVIYIVVPSATNRRGGLAFAIEDNRWLVTLTSRNNEPTPIELAEFQAYAGSLDMPEIGAIVHDHEPLDDGTTYAFRASRYCHYERLDRFPRGIVPIADSICSFNPVYGQGMTVAAIEANLLAKALAEGDDNLAARFLKMSTPSIETAWKMSTGTDMRYSVERHQLPRKARLLYWYLDCLHVAARTDHHVSAAFGRVLHMLEEPSSLMRPGTLARVIAHGRNGRAKTTSPTRERILDGPMRELAADPARIDAEGVTR